MKIVVVSLFTICVCQEGASASNAEVPSPVFRPQRIPYSSLVSDEEFDHDGSTVKASFQDALTHVGMVSVTGVFDDDTGTKRALWKDTLAYLHDCAMTSEAAQAHTYGDGTVRHTMASISIPGIGGGSGIQPIHHGNASGSSPCERFSKASDTFREIVGEVTQVFAERLTSLLAFKNGIEDVPLLSTKYDFNFDTLADVVENGEHLEHFHSYQKPASKQGRDDETIEWHTDQGLFLVFTPGRKVNFHHKNEEATVTSGFYIQQDDGSQALVEFGDEDDLVFMLGDGVNQYVNPRIKDGRRTLRATPHSVSMPDHDEDEARVWYGRMVLPPAQAIHPEHGISFGELREQMITASASHPQSEADPSYYSLGCSSDMVPRQLEDVTCVGESMYCWHRCMNYSDFNVTADLCESRNLVLNCTNPRGQLWDGNHGDFYPGCIRSDAEIATPYPPLPTAPRSNVTCTNESFVDFASSDGLFEHEFDLVGDHMGAKFMWSVVNDEVHGRLAFNGLFGWIAFGFANPDGAKNGMHGGHVIMALPGTDYNASIGLDLDGGLSIDDYIIDEDSQKSSFRHWQEPYAVTARSIIGAAEIMSSDCFTSLSFNATSIAAQFFNFSGGDHLMWAANDVDYFVGYHGQARGRFYIDWTTGSAEEYVPPPAVVTPTATPPTATPPTKDGDHDHDHDGAPAAAPTTSSSLAVVPNFAVSLFAVIVIFLGL